MTLHLPEDLERFIHAEVLRGNFASEEALVAEALREFQSRRTESGLARSQAPAAQQEVAAQKPVWERILERSTSVPDEEWDKLPADLAEQHDHYVYGTAKRPTA
jgi:Arc/MetJ-type ribon-helix-helix transcriptional regulator